ncbi:Uncharacterised protein [Oligella urethralis]|uniref:hypothetical protein n=1 Tax=Oligella urethralis TaxID=90245 RepID=UPI000E01CA13|nr:hypothetical protein [Oligella urethralis]SUA63283.1 Uncharacterised protein [Oligella urethralis]
MITFIKIVAYLILILVGGVSAFLMGAVFLGIISFLPYIIVGGGIIMLAFMIITSKPFDD